MGRLLRGATGGTKEAELTQAAQAGGVDSTQAESPRAGVGKALSPEAGILGVRKALHLLFKDPLRVRSHAGGFCGDTVQP